MSFLVIMTFNATAGGIQEPTSAKAILSNINYALQHNSLLNEKNYNVEYFQQIFGSPARNEWDSHETKNYNFFISAKDLNLEITEAAHKVDGINIDIYRLPKQGKVSKTLVTVNLPAFISLKIEDLTPIFGNNWQEDKEAEMKKFMAIPREAFNPPPPKSTDAMGNKIINYSFGRYEQNKITIEFTSDGKAWMISVIQYPD